MCGDGCSLALWWSFHNTYVYWIVMSIPETNESSASVKSWYKNMYQLWKQKRWGRDQDGRVEECGACLPSMNTSKMHLTCGTILTEYQLKAGRRSPIQPKRQERSLHNRVGRKRKEKRKIRMAPKPLGGSSERGKFPWPQEAPLQQLGAEAWATASRTGERTLAVPGVWSGLSPWVQAGQSKGPPEKHLYAYMKGGAQVCHYTPRRQHVHGPAGFQPPGALRGLVPEGELTSGPIKRYSHSRQASVDLRTSGWPEVRLMSELITRAPPEGLGLGAAPAAANFVDTHTRWWGLPQSHTSWWTAKGIKKDCWQKCRWL